MWISLRHFLKMQTVQLFVWFRYVVEVFFKWTNGKKKLENIMTELNIFSDRLSLVKKVLTV